MSINHSHEPEAIAKRLSGGPKVNYLRDWIYGGIDGAVTTFAIVAGVVGAELSAGVVLILGLANLLADGFSMAASNYSGTKADTDDYARLREVELEHIRNNPEGEREEIRQIYRGKGYEGDELENMVTLITEHREVWLNTMLSEEYGRADVQRSALMAALSTFVAFVICGSVPLVPFLLGIENAALWATGMTAIVFFGIGAVKSRWSLQGWLSSAIETLAIGLAAAGIAYGVGVLLSGLTGGVA